MSKIIPHLWFDAEAEQAARFYVSIFSKKRKNSHLGDITRYAKAAEAVSGKSAGSVMTASFALDGQQFMALNGGPIFKFNESISFMVLCKNQEEIDYFWQKLGEGGDENAKQCGWLKDKYGLSWQIVPANLGDLLASKDTATSEKVMAAFLQMKKIDLNALKNIVKKNDTAN